MVWGNYNNNNFLVFLDSGASVNLMGEDLYNEKFKNLPLLDTRETVCDIHTQKIDVVGKVSLTLFIAGQKISDYVLVARGVNLGSVILLGHPSCIKNGISLCPPKRGIFVEAGDRLIFTPYAKVEKECVSLEDVSGNNKEIRLINELLCHNFSAKAIVKQDIEVVSGKPNYVCVQVKGVKDGVSVVGIEGSERVQQMVAVTALNVVENGEVWLEMLKLGEDSHRLKRGTYLMDLEIFSLPVKVVSQSEGEKLWLVEDVSVSAELEEKREKILKKKLEKSDLKEYNDRVRDLLMQYPDVVACKDDTLGVTKVIQHQIVLEPGTQPIYIPAYRLPVKVKGEVEKIVGDWEKEGIIRKSVSPLNFPLLAVPKKDGSWRVCVDFRKLNSKTVPDRYPKACMLDLVAEIGGKKFYSSIDLLQGFLQVPLAEHCKKYTAFSTPTGHWEFERMPFGLQGSPTTFTRLVNTVFHGMLGKTVFIYMDDLLIGSNSIEEHIAILREVLHRLRGAGLKLKLEKCDF